MASGFLASGQAVPASQGRFQLPDQSSFLAFLIPLSPEMLVKTDSDIYIYIYYTYLMYIGLIYIYIYVPQTDSSVEVLTVLVKGPWFLPCSVEFAVHHFSL